MHQRGIVFFIMLWPMASVASDTQLNLYRPFAETSKHVPVSITETIRGHCSQQSERIEREDAWHCVSSQGKVYDPCFSKRFDTKARVICSQSPWAAKSIEMTLDEPIDDSAQKSLDMSRTLPWAIELKNGEHCLSVASDEMYNGVQVQYQCSRSAVLLGDAHRCSPTWSILKHDESGTSVAEIATAWF